MLPQLRKFQISKKLKTKFKKEENKYYYDDCNDSFYMMDIETVCDDLFNPDYDQSKFIDQTLLVNLGKQLWRFMISRVL